MHGDSEQGEILPGWAQRRSRTATRPAPSRALSPSPKEANAKKVERGRTGSATSAHNLARRHRDDMKDYVTEEETLQKRSRIHHKPTRQDQRQNKGSEASMWSPNIVAPATRWAEAAHPSRSKVIYSSDVGRTLSDVDEHSELFYHHQESSSPGGGHVVVASLPPDSMTPHDAGNTDLFAGGSPASSVSEHSTSPLFSALPKLLSCSTRLTRPRPSRPWRHPRFELRPRTRILPSRTWLIRTRDFLASHQRFVQGPRLQHTLCVVCAQNRCSSIMGRTLVSARIVLPTLPRAAPGDNYNSSRSRSSSNQNKTGEWQERMKWTIRYLPKRLAATFGFVVQAARYYHAIGQQYH